MVLKSIKNAYEAIKFPEISEANVKKINNSLSNVSLIALASLAYLVKPREFLAAVALGALWQTTLIVLKVKRSDCDDGCGAGMGCVDGYSKWFIGENPLHLEKVAGGTWLAAEHILHHPKHVTFANFMGVCMGIRLMLLVRDTVTKQHQTQHVAVHHHHHAH